MKAVLSWFPHKYIRFLFVGGCVGIATVAIREGMARLLPEDTPEYYLVSVVVAYGFGIIASFLLHWSVTFGRHHQINVGVFLRFFGVALAGLAATSGLSLAIRYALPTAAYLAAYSGMFSFAAATLCASLLTYLLNNYFVFPSSGVGDSSNRF